ncbi:hypothetical protein Aph01nite_78550 [Acrocarpospora phusangensis]|uniref:Peptidase C51 domain-containing protein n=2 Tax=Acrocarpospora phusangensis TaxID=1070424 RepID=A0A919QNL0_9ACTN|nr:hypothetical protein Aph01nite_78550 [Acrocarpospora phusangensis]
MEKLISLLRQEASYTERPDGRTKFGKWYNKVEKDADYSTQPWCDMFLSWGASKLGYEKWFGQFAWTVGHARWFREQNAWGQEAKPGAVVFYDWDGSGSIDGIDHVGLVTAVDGRKITTIEGNVEGIHVREKTRDQSLVVGYGYPDQIRERLQPTPQTDKPDVAPSVRDHGTPHDKPWKTTPSDGTPSATTPSDNKPWQNSGTTPSTTTPSDSTPSETTPSNPTPSATTPSESTPSATPSGDTPSESTPSDNTPSDSRPSENTPWDSKPSDATPSDSTTSDTATSDSTTSDSTTTGSTTSDTAASDSTASDSTASDTTTTDNASSENTPSNSTTTGDTTSESTPTDNTSNWGGSENASDDTAGPVAKESTGSANPTNNTGEAHASRTPEKHAAKTPSKHPALAAPPAKSQTTTVIDHLTTSPVSAFQPIPGSSQLLHAEAVIAPLLVVLVAFGYAKRRRTHRLAIAAATRSGAIASSDFSSWFEPSEPSPEDTVVWPAPPPPPPSVPTRPYHLFSDPVWPAPTADATQEFPAPTTYRGKHTKPEASDIYRTGTLPEALAATWADRPGQSPRGRHRRA